MFDKDKFAEQLKTIARYGEEERKLTTSIRQREAEIAELNGNIAEIDGDLIRAIVMRRATKEKKRAQIAQFDEHIAQKRQEIAALKEELRILTVRTFGAEELPPVYFGSYPQGKDGEVMPLQWDVLYRRENLVLLTTTHIIEHMKYAEVLENTPWEFSQIRKWLNGEFLEKWFSPEEKAMIFEKEIANPGNDPYKTPAGENTVDRVFLPSISEVKRFTDYDEDRLARATEYAKARGVYVNEETGGSYWWLRSNGGNLYNAAVVNFTGYVFEYGFYIVCERYGIRPSVWIRLK